MGAPVRVLRVADIPASSLGGVHGYMAHTGDVLVGEGHEVANLFREDLGGRPRYGGLRRLVVPWVIPLRVAALARRGRRFDAVEIHEPLAAPYALLARRGWLPPCVVLSHGLGERLWLETKRYARRRGGRVPLKSRVLVPWTLVAPSRLGIRRAARVVVLSSEDADYVRDRMAVPAERVVMAPSGVGDAFFGAPREGSDVGGLRVVFVGTWIERKGTRELVEAWAAICRTHALARLTVVGTGISDDRVLADFAPECRDRVTVIPDIDPGDLPRLLGEHDLFVLPTWFEGMPLSLLEAAAAGLPCIAGATSGNLDFFPPEDPEAHGGVLVPVQDPVALASAITRFLDEPGLTRTLGARARVRARSFRWHDTAHNLLTAYEGAVREARREAGTS